MRILLNPVNYVDKTTLYVWNFQVFGSKPVRVFEYRLIQEIRPLVPHISVKPVTNFTTEVSREQEGFETNEPKGSVRKNHDDK